MCLIVEFKNQNFSFIYIFIIERYIIDVLLSKKWCTLLESVDSTGLGKRNGKAFQWNKKVLLINKKFKKVGLMNNIRKEIE